MEHRGGNHKSEREFITPGSSICQVFSKYKTNDKCGEASVIGLVKDFSLMERALFLIQRQLDKHKNNANMQLLTSRLTVLKDIWICPWNTSEISNNKMLRSTLRQVFFKQLQKGIKGPKLKILFHGEMGKRENIPYSETCTHIYRYSHVQGKYRSQLRLVQAHCLYMLI